MPLREETEHSLHAWVVCDLQFGMVQYTNPSAKVLCTMTVLARHFACPSAMGALITVQLQPKVFGTLDDHSSC